MRISIYYFISVVFFCLLYVFAYGWVGINFIVLFIFNVIFGLHDAS